MGLTCIEVPPWSMGFECLCSVMACSEVFGVFFFFFFPTEPKAEFKNKHTSPSSVSGPLFELVERDCYF